MQLFAFNKNIYTNECALFVHRRHNVTKYFWVFVQVHDIKEELANLGERMEEMRSVCRQLQSQLKNFPDCSETSFEAEADTLMDNWLDVSGSAFNIYCRLQNI